MVKRECVSATHHKNIESRVAPLIVKADLKHLTYVYTGGESDLKYW